MAEHISSVIDVGGGHLGWALLPNWEDGPLSIDGPGAAESLAITSSPSPQSPAPDHHLIHTWPRLPTQGRNFLPEHLQMHSSPPMPILSPSLCDPRPCLDFHGYHPHILCSLSCISDIALLTGSATSVQISFLFHKTHQLRTKCFCPPPIHMRKPQTPSMAVCGDEVSTEVIKIQWSHKCGSMIPQD